MDEYIKRTDVLSYPIRANKCDMERADEHFIFGIEDVMEYVENLPAADVAPVRHGKWINAYIRGQHHYRCSGCGEYTEATWHSNFVYNYCPNCGAKMDLEGRQWNG